MTMTHSNQYYNKSNSYIATIVIYIYLTTNKSQCRVKLFLFALDPSYILPSQKSRSKARNRHPLFVNRMNMTQTFINFDYLGLYTTSNCKNDSFSSNKDTITPQSPATVNDYISVSAHSINTKRVVCLQLSNSLGGQPARI